MISCLIIIPTTAGPPQLPTNLTAVQTGLNTVLVSWTAPPGGMYRVTADPGGVSVENSVSPQTITVQTHGVNNITVMTFSQHYPGGTLGPVEVTVRGSYVSKLNTQFKNVE